MKCERCGKKTIKKSKLCEECLQKEKDKELDEDVLLYNLYEDSLKEDQDEPLDVPEQKATAQKNRRTDIAITIMKVVMSVNILLFIILLFFPWFQLGGEVTYEGFVQIPRFIATEEYDQLSGEQISTFEGDYVSLSPIRMIGYSLRFFDEYGKSIDDNGEEKVTILPSVHLVVILLFILIMVMDALAIILLLGTKRFKAIVFVKITSIVNLLVLGLNFLFLKLTYINMFALKAIDNMRMKDSVNAISMTTKGIAINRDFYPYTMNYNDALKYALILLAAWLLISSILAEIKRRWDYENGDEELIHDNPK